jgi:hypothetical protein
MPSLSIGTLLAPVATSTAMGRAILIMLPMTRPKGTLLAIPPNERRKFIPRCRLLAASLRKNCQNFKRGFALSALGQTRN